jgi:putative ABC transport system permease protein
MTWVRRFVNLFRQGRVNRELDEELASHLDEAIERGRTATEARRALGSALQHREASRDLKLLPRLDALTSDVRFGWRQLNKHRAASIAAVLSLALAIGTTTAVFRLADAVLLRPLPVADPHRLFYLATHYLDRESRPDFREEFDYPTFHKYRDLVADEADLMVAGMTARKDVFFRPGATEKIFRQFLSGNAFAVFGLRPALGRLLTPNDDAVPGGHPVAVLSYDYWTRRFGRDPKALGQTFRLEKDRYEIIGVAPEGFVGTEPGEVVDVFLPAMMNAEAIYNAHWSWMRIWVRPKDGVSAEQVRQPLRSVFQQEQQEELRKFQPGTPRQVIDAYLSQKLMLLPAAAGASRLQKEYRGPLIILGVLVALVLLVACANVGNLLTAQAAARAREMALRVSIGAGRWRLVQLMLVESAMLATFGSALGALFAGWSAPLVVSMLRVPGNPVRLVLNVGWRELGFGAALALFVTLFFGLAPALRASAVQPVSALKGGDDPHSRRRLMKTLLAAQMAFCVLVQFVAGLFVTTFQRLSNRPLGFSPERVLVMEAEGRAEYPLATWMQVADRLRSIPGVESVALAAWPLLSGNRWTGSVRIPGQSVKARPPYFLDVSPGFFATMRIELLDGRDFRPDDIAPSVPPVVVPGVGIVNEAFARAYFDGQNPVGRSIDVHQVKDTSVPMQIVGYVRDAAYATMREPIRPTIYVPQGPRGHSTFVVRTAGKPGTLAALLRRRVTEARSDIEVSTIQTQTDFILWHTIRERLLAALSSFFAIVALVLASIGLYGVLNYSVTGQRREIGIRMTLGARPAQVVRRVIAGSFAAAGLGLSIGLAGGVACGRFVESLLFEVKATEPAMLAAPLIALLVAAILAALPPAIRAVRIDPAQTIRSE